MENKRLSWRNLNLILIAGISVLLIITLSMSGCTGPKGDGNQNITNGNPPAGNESAGTPEPPKPPAEVVESGDSVEVNYVGKFENGTVFDASKGEPLAFTVGAGNMIKGFDEAVAGMKAGEKKTVTILPEKAYGEWNPNFTIVAKRIVNLSVLEFNNILSKEPPVAGSKYNVSGIEVEVMDVKNTTRVLKDSDRNVIFYHADWCPHCKNMEPLVAELEKSGYKFNSVYNLDPDFEAKKQEFSDVINTGEGIPQFGCRANGELHVGEFESKDALKVFADACRNATGIKTVVVVRQNPFFGMIVTDSMGSQAKIIEVTDTNFTVDTNHQLAGKTLVFDITIVSIKKIKAKYVPDKAPEGGFATFKSNDPNAQICVDGKKPIVYMFSTTGCPHCLWVKETFDKVAKEYVASGKIAAYHWDLDKNDNTLTPEVEISVPDLDSSIYQKFNPGGSVPTFVFGCKYYRVGTGYEGQNDISSEEKEFRAVIEHMIKSSEGS